jgi:alkanesulfonate monooxygenase SsuD/methylene tetrahydromethanopterin reductase-like flavin-dependent oxidoreductase (luciferase family)
VGRDPADIELTVSFPIVLRDDPAAAEQAYAASLAHNGADNMGNVPTLLGPPAMVADALRPYAEMGFATVIVRLPNPYDRETIGRTGEVAELLADA